MKYIAQDEYFQKDMAYNVKPCSTIYEGSALVSLGVGI